MKFYLWVVQKSSFRSARHNWFLSLHIPVISFQYLKLIVCLIVFHASLDSQLFIKYISCRQKIVMIATSSCFTRLGHLFLASHYSGVIMTAKVSQINGLSIVCSTVCSGADQSTASLGPDRGIHRWPVDSPHKGPATRKIFPFYHVIMSFYIYRRCYFVVQLLSSNNLIMGILHIDMIYNAF